jgi:hypothetical protein
MHKSATKCNETIGKWCKNKHGASKIIDTFETYHAAGLDGPSFMFYQTFCDIVKFDLIAMFNACHGDNLDLYKLNFAMITLITKENDARSMKILVL